MYQFSPSLIKLPRWNVQPHLTAAPELWRDAESVIPLWEFNSAPAILGSDPTIFGLEDGSIDWHASVYGLALQFNGVNKYTAQQNNFQRANNEATLICAFKYDSSSSDSFGGIVGFRDGSGNNELTIQRYSTSKDLSVYVDGNTSNHKVQLANGLVEDEWKVYVARFINGEATVSRFNLNGQKEAENSGYPSNTGTEIVYGTTTELVLGSERGLAAEISGEMSLVVAASRAWSDFELSHLSCDPFAMLRPSPQLLPTLFSGAGTTAETSLTTNDSAHTHTTDQTSFTQAHDYAVDGSSHVHAADVTSFTQVHSLNVDDSVHANVADAVSFSQVHAVNVQSAAHIHVTGQTAFDQTHILGVDESAHTHVSDTIGLGTEDTFAVDDSAHVHVFNTVGFTQDHVFSTDDGIHTHAANETSYTQNHELVLNGATHGHTVERATFSEISILDVKSTVHDNVADATSFSQIHELGAQDSIHNHKLALVSFLQQHNFTLNNSAHAYVADEVDFISSEAGVSERRVSRVGLNKAIITGRTPNQAGVMNG